MGSANSRLALAQYPALIRVAAFLLVLILLWVPFAAPIAWLVKDPNTETILTMSLLFLEFLLLLPVWGRRVHGISHVFRAYGLGFSRKRGIELWIGLGLGLGSLMLMFWVQKWLGWLIWQPSSSGPQIVLEGLISALGVGLAEELVFRGWLLDELDRDYSTHTARWANSLIFAGLHFLKPWTEMLRTFPQLPGLVLLGLALVWAKRSTQGRLALSIGLHAGLVWAYYILRVGALTEYTDRVPAWITGIDDNPLAGLIGILFLAGITSLMHYASRSNKSF